jgi:hypothetical protein
MSKSNREAKRLLILKYGEICFIEELHLRTQEEIDKERKTRYKGKKQLEICDKITYHHILEKCKGGKATVENGALLRYINHQWLHRLSKEKQAEINELFLEYKRTHSQECQVVFVEKVDTDYKIEAFTFTPEDLKQKKKYNRAKDKRENQKIINEWEEEKC